MSRRSSSSPYADWSASTPLRANTYRVRFMIGMALRADHLQLCGQLAGRIHLNRVTRPDHGFQLDNLIDQILADIAANP